jgi:hypothetical protein
MRLHIARTVIGDFAELQTYSQLGKLGANARTKKHVEKIVDNTIVNDVIPFIAGQMTGNDLAAPVIKYVLEDTELGDMIRSNSEILPMVLQALSKYNLQEFMAGQSVQDMSGGKPYG